VDLQGSRNSTQSSSIFGGMPLLILMHLDHMDKLILGIALNFFLKNLALKILVRIYTFFLTREKANKIAGGQRIPRSLLEEEPPPLMSPEETRKLLLKAFESHHEWDGGALPAKGHRQGRASTNVDIGEGCVPPRLCPTSYNTSAPMYGISLTSGQPVTIVQKFPDLLQQVVYQVCK